MLSDANHRGELQLFRHFNVRSIESDDEADKECPILDNYYEADGNDGMVKMTNFTTNEFEDMYGYLHEYFTTHWDVGRGRGSSVKLMDSLFMLLTVLEHEGSWKILAWVFRIKYPTFKRLLVDFMPVVTLKNFRLFVDIVADIYNITHLREQGKTFRYYKHIVEAIDVTSQQTNRPSGSMDKEKKNSSGKHKFYGKNRRSLSVRMVCRGVQQAIPWDIVEYYDFDEAQGRAQKAYGEVWGE